MTIRSTARFAAVATASPRLTGRLAGGDRLDRQRLDDQRPSWRGKAEPHTVRLGKQRHGLIRRAIGHHQRRVGPGIAQMQ